MRVIFQRSSSGLHTVRGGLVEALQQGLLDQGHDPGPVDGVFGNFTERAVRAFQQAAGLDVHGRVDVDTWKGATGAPPPSLFVRCLQLTASFEGHGFGRVAGNFDGAGLTWGIIGFTLAHGEIQGLLGEIEEQDPGALDAAFGELAGALREMLDWPLVQQMAWAGSITVGADRSRVAAPWAEAFRRLGARQSVQRLQTERAVERYWLPARTAAAELGLGSELGVALCFDIQVQNGGLDELERQRVDFRFTREPDLSARDRRLIVADVAAEGSRPQWVEDVRARKQTLALGLGTVHGARYRLSDWGLDDLPAPGPDDDGSLAYQPEPVPGDEA